MFYNVEMGFNALDEDFDFYTIIKNARKARNLNFEDQGEQRMTAVVIEPEPEIYKSKVGGIPMDLVKAPAIKSSDQINEESPNSTDSPPRPVTSEKFLQRGIPQDLVKATGMPPFPEMSPVIRPHDGAKLAPLSTIKPMPFGFP